MPGSSTIQDQSIGRWLPIAIGAAFFAVLFAVWPRPIQEMPLHVYLTEAETVRFDGPSLTAEAQKAFEAEFSEARFFSAFAMAPNGRWGWAIDRHSVASARREALAWCGGWGAWGCVVVAERRPVGYRGEEAVQTLSEAAIEVGRRTPPERGMPVVWGISSDGSWYVDQPPEATEDEAARARQVCQQFVVGFRSPLFPSRRCVAGMGPVVLIDG